MSQWESRSWSPGICRLWHADDTPDAPCNVEYIYSTGSIASVRVIHTPQHSVCVAWRDGRRAEWMNDTLDVGGVYQRQFGISVSEDGRFLFVQTWERGLHCLDAASGRCVWRSRSRRGVTSLMVNGSTLAVLQREHALLMMDIETGEVLKEKRPARAWSFYPLTPAHFIYQTTARQWEIVRANTLETVQTIPHQLFPNTSGELPWCIRDVWLEENQLWCSAFRSVSPQSTDILEETFLLPVQPHIPL